MSKKLSRRARKVPVEIIRRLIVTPEYEDYGPCFNRAVCLAAWLKINIEDLALLSDTDLRAFSNIGPGTVRWVRTNYSSDYIRSVEERRTLHWEYIFNNTGVSIVNGKPQQWR